MNDAESKTNLPPLTPTTRTRTQIQTQLKTKFKLSEDDKLEYENIFNLIAGEEKNISAKEIGRVMSKLGMHCSIEELNDMIEVVDKDGYGLIHKKHFMNLVTQKVKENSQENDGELYAAAFEIFDHDKDGRLSMADIRSIMLSIGEKVCDCEIEEMLAAHDCSPDEAGGGITYEAFLKLLVA